MDKARYVHYWEQLYLYCYSLAPSSLGVLSHVHCISHWKTLGGASALV